jgi:hypothetical protein
MQIDDPNIVLETLTSQTEYFFLKKKKKKTPAEKAESSKKKNKVPSKTNALYSDSQRLTFTDRMKDLPEGGRSAAKIGRELGMNEHVAQGILLYLVNNTQRGTIIFFE